MKWLGNMSLKELGDIYEWIQKEKRKDNQKSNK